MLLLPQSPLSIPGRGRGPSRTNGLNGIVQIAFRISSMSTTAGLHEGYDAGLSGHAIRALRGGESRAAFARRLGVTPHTVYRWELPEQAEEVRRPRGVVLERLRAMAGGAASIPPAPVPVAQDPAMLASALAGFAQLLQGEWRAAGPGPPPPPPPPRRA